MQSRRDVQRQKSRVSVKKITLRSLIVLLLLILIGWGSFTLANQPVRNARKQAITLAKKYTSFKSPGRFYVYNREQTYYTISGKNAKNQQILVIVPQKGGNLRVVKQASGLTRQEAIAQVKATNSVKRVLKAAPGIFNDRVVWEVTYKNAKGNLCYELINFKTGKAVQRINNL